MTIINQAELAQLTRLDQGLMWAIMSIAASNKDPRNTFISDNAAIRAESENYVQWSVTQDDTGQGKFIYTALLPLVNPHPLQDKDSLIERVWSYSPFDPDMITEPDILGYGAKLNPIPIWADTTERLLTHIGIVATLISKYARLTTGDEAFWEGIHPEYWADCQYQIADSNLGGTVTLSGSLSIDWTSYLKGRSLIKCLNPYDGHANDVNCNFPLLALLWATPPVDIFTPPQALAPLIPTTGTLAVFPGGLIQMIGAGADALINSYNQSYFSDDALPDWYGAAINNPSGGEAASPTGTQVLGNATPQLIESLAICKEQDPDMISYANQLGEKLPKK